MKKEDKEKIVEELSQDLSERKNFYITDISTLSSNETNDLRKAAYQKGIVIKVYKNTMIRKALDRAGLDIPEFKDVLVGSSSIMFAEAVNAPAKLIKAFRKDKERPMVKAAYLEESTYVGDEQIDTLASLKSKEELIADVVALLQSPIKNVISGLKTAGQNIAGILKTLEERG